VKRKLERLQFSTDHPFSKFEVPVVVNLKHIFELFGLESGLFKVDLEFSFSIPGLFQTWNSNKPGFEKLNSRSELELSKKAIVK
jgi:hypothetical protein